MKNDSLMWLVVGGVLFYLFSRNKTPQGVDCYPTNFIGPIPNGASYCDELVDSFQSNLTDPGVTCLDPTGKAYNIPVGPCPSYLPAAGVPLQSVPTLTVETNNFPNPNQYY